jgi:hypothetical protein
MTMASKTIAQMIAELPPKPFTFPTPRAAEIRLTAEVELLRAALIGMGELAYDWDLDGPAVDDANKVLDVTK